VNMPAENDLHPRLRAKLNELEAHVRQRLRPTEILVLPALVDAVQVPGKQWGQSETLSATDRGRAGPRASLEGTATRLPAAASAGGLNEHPESFMSRIARFFGGGR